MSQSIGFAPGTTDRETTRTRTGNPVVIHVECTCKYRILSANGPPLITFMRLSANRVPGLEWPGFSVRGQGPGLSGDADRPVYQKRIRHHGPRVVGTRSYERRGHPLCSGRMQPLSPFQSDDYGGLESLKEEVRGCPFAGQTSLFLIAREMASPTEFTESFS